MNQNNQHSNFPQLGLRPRKSPFQNQHRSIQQGIQKLIDTQCVFYQAPWNNTNLIDDKKTTHVFKSVVQDSLIDQEHPINKIIIENDTKSFVPFVKERNALGRLLTPSNVQFQPYQINSFFDKATSLSGIKKLNQSPSFHIDRAKRSVHSQKQSLRTSLIETQELPSKIDSLNSESTSSQLTKNKKLNEILRIVKRTPLVDYFDPSQITQHKSKFEYSPFLQGYKLDKMRLPSNSQKIQQKQGLVKQQKQQLLKDEESQQILEQTAVKKQNQKYLNKIHPPKKNTQALNLYQSFYIVQQFNQKNQGYQQPMNLKSDFILYIQVTDRIKEFQKQVLINRNPQTRKKTYILATNKMKRFLITFLLLIHPRNTLYQIIETLEKQEN